MRLVDRFPERPAALIDVPVVAISLDRPFGAAVEVKEQPDADVVLVRQVEQRADAGEIDLAGAGLQRAPDQPDADGVESRTPHGGEVAFPILGPGAHAPEILSAGREGSEGGRRIDGLRHVGPVDATIVDTYDMAD